MADRHWVRTWFLLLALGTSPAAVGDALPMERLAVPAGFVIEVLIDDTPNARQMALGADGTLFVGTRRAGRVYAVENALTEPAKARVIADDLRMPSGVAVHDGNLYVGAVNRVLRFSAIEAWLAAHADGQPKAEIITDALPTDGHHGWKYLKFSPSGTLHVPVGAPCNICLSKDPRYASLLTLDLASGSTELYAEGIRNTVGFDWHPETGDLWFTDNGRDMLGDDVPPEEVNVAPRAGLHFGYPFEHAGTIADPEFGKQRVRTLGERALEKPKVKIQAHSAALGIDFYDGAAFPEDYRHALFIAEHGSWNRSSKVGYRISVVLDPNGAATYRPFIEGWLDDEENWGRPNDVLVTPAGNLLISDDQAGAIYRVRYVGDRRAVAALSN
ncbi:MAG: PQQ-dependent sugar dehydrogenase [Pseudomonadota bacterium]